VTEWLTWINGNIIFRPLFSLVERSHSYLRFHFLLAEHFQIWSSLEFDLTSSFTIWLVELTALTTPTRISSNQMFVKEQILVEQLPPTPQPVLFLKIRVLLFSEY
jgi:hypothetical protein